MCRNPRRHPVAYIVLLGFSSFLQYLVCLGDDMKRAFKFL